MINKKTILLSLAILLVLIIAIYLFSVWKKSSTDSPKPNTPPDTSFNTNPSIPTPIPATKEPSPNHGKIIVSDPASISDIKNSFDNFIQATQNDKIAKTDTQWIEITDKKGEPVSLNAFSSSLGLKISPEISPLLDATSYNIFYCSNGDKKDYGLSLDLRLLPNYPNLYPDIQKFMEEWEKTLLRDTHSVIFPGVDFSQDDLDQKVEFKKGTYRFADILLPDGTHNSLNYNLVSDSIAITSTLDCLKKASLATETLEP